MILSRYWQHIRLLSTASLWQIVAVVNQRRGRTRASWQETWGFTNTRAWLTIPLALPADTCGRQDRDDHVARKTRVLENTARLVNPRHGVTEVIVSVCVTSSSHLDIHNWVDRKWVKEAISNYLPLHFHFLEEQWPDHHHTNTICDVIFIPHDHRLIQTRPPHLGHCPVLHGWNWSCGNKT